jgi:hypothetical protein
LEELDKDDAEYPRKITYHNPPNLALEALEVILLLHFCPPYTFRKESKDNRQD